MLHTVCSRVYNFSTADFRNLFFDLFQLLVRDSLSENKESSRGTFVKSNVRWAAEYRLQHVLEK